MSKADSAFVGAYAELEPESVLRLTSCRLLRLWQACDKLVTSSSSILGAIANCPKFALRTLTVLLLEPLESIGNCQEESITQDLLAV